MECIRYDKAVIKATRTDEGYLVDTPVVGRTGIQEYRRADGSIRRELRPPEEVFHADSLASFAGKPITDGHPKAMVTAANAKALSVGTIRGDGKQDGDDVLAPIIVHDAGMIDKADKGGVRELSLGYKVDLDETPGEWNGQRYDAVQRNIRVNHLAFVRKGRAGNARINLDRFDAASFETEEDVKPMSETLGRIRLDSGLEYQAAPEVIVAFDAMRTKLTEANARADGAQKNVDTVAAERDALQARVDGFKDELDAANGKAIETVKARMALEGVASEFKVDHADKSDREIKEGVIKAVRNDADLTGKSDAYVDAAFDMAVETRKDESIRRQREAGGRTDGIDPSQKTSKELRADYLASRGKKD